MAISEHYFGELAAETELLLRKVKDHPSFEDAVKEFWVTLKVMDQSKSMRFKDLRLVVDTWRLFLQSQRQDMDVKETDVDCPF